MEKASISLMIGAAISSTFSTTVGRVETKVAKLGDAIRANLRQEKTATDVVARKDALSALEAKLDAAQKRLASASGGLTAGPPTKQMAQEISKASKEYDRLYASVEKAKGALQKAESNHRHAAEEADKQARSLGRLGQSMDAMRSKHERLSTAMQKHQAAQQRLAHARGGLFDMVAIGATFKAMIGGATDFQSTLTDIAITADIPRDKIKAIGHEMGGLAKETGQTREEIAEAFKTLTAKGMGAEDAQASLRAIGLTATASGAAVDDVAKTVFAVFDNLKVAPGEAIKAMDMLTTAGKQGSFELVDMARHFPTLTASMQTLKVKGTEGVASLGAMLQIASRGAGSNDEAANNLKNFLAQLTAPKTIKRFADNYGFDVEKRMKEAARRGINPVEDMIQVIKELTGGDQFEIGKLFGNQQVKQFLAPMLENMEEYKRIKKEVMAAEGTVEADANRRMEDDPAFKWKMLGESLRNLRDAAIVPVLGPITKLTDGIVKILHPVATFMQQNETLVSVIGTTIGILVSGKVAMLGIGYALSIVRVGMTALNLAFVTNPIGAVLMGIAIAAMVVYAHWDKIGPMMIAVWDGIQTKIFDVVDYFKTLPEQMGQIALDMCMGLSNGIRNAWDSVKDSAAGLADSAVSSVKNFLGINSPSRVFAEIGSSVGEGMTLGINRSGKGVLGSIGSLAKGMAKPLQAGLATLFSATSLPALALSSAAALLPADGGHAAAAAKGNSYEINITVNGIANERLLADMVRDVLEEQARKDALVRNGRTFDL